MPLTQSQQQAVAARGNVIVVAGAGTGKTSTLVERCLHVVRGGCSLENVLMVTFTEAAAAEMRHRLRVALEQLADAVSEAGLDAEPARQGLSPERLAEQLALVETARISTLHSFCLGLVQSHFHVLAVDPEVRVLDERQCRVLMDETLEALFQECYRGDLPISEGVRQLVTVYGQGWDGVVREMVRRLHVFSRTLPNPDGWLQDQRVGWISDEPGQWRHLLVEGFLEWRRLWLPVLKPFTAVSNVAGCVAALETVPASPDAGQILASLRAIAKADASEWERGTKGAARGANKKFFEEAAFLSSTMEEGALGEDWQLVRGPMLALLDLAAEFGARFDRAKRDLGGVDFADLEQLSLRLLRDEHGATSTIAKEQHRRIEYVFVDECQDINGVQDAILRRLGREGPAANRFLVGDVKQSIYQFRLADPRIFLGYERAWAGDSAGQRIALADNYRSRSSILAFVNACFGSLMRASVGGVAYEPLRPGEGSPMQTMADGPCVELHLMRGPGGANGGAESESMDERSAVEDLSSVEREARLVAWRLRGLKQSGFRIWDKDQGEERPVEWRDMAVLLRSPRGRTEAFAKEFHRAGIPLSTARAGFLDATEVSDLVSLLHLLDNPLQDIPLLAVLRSPLVGLTLDELALIRVSNVEQPFWRALRTIAGQPGDAAAVRQELLPKVTGFLEQFFRWRESARQIGPSLCLEQVLADTGYDVLTGAGDRGVERLANVRRLLDLARQFDPYLRQGLYRFLRYLKGLEEAGESLEPASVPAREAVRLMSIHGSKGLEFPVVALAGLGSRFNLQDLNSVILLDPELGLAPKAVTASGNTRYPTLPFWLAARRQRERQLGEELRLLYVAATRARDRLICSAVLPAKGGTRWESDVGGAVSDMDLLSGSNAMSWLLRWLPTVTREEDWNNDHQGKSELMTWEIWESNDERLNVGQASNLSPTPDEEPPASRTELRPVQENVGDSEQKSEDRLEACPSLVAEVRERLTWTYPHLPATVERAKSSVSALRARVLELMDEEAVARFAIPHGSRVRGEGGPFSAAERGTLHHRFLQHLEIPSAANVEALERQAAGMIGRGLFTPKEVNALDLAKVAGFWKSPVGGRIRERVQHVRRELPFTARMSVGELPFGLGSGFPTGEDEFVVIQGVADLVVLQPKEIWLLDFKTDEVFEQQLELRAKDYLPQIQLYGAALERTFHRPVTEHWLHFLAAGTTVAVQAASLTRDGAGINPSQREFGF